MRLGFPFNPSLALLRNRLRKTSHLLRDPPVTVNGGSAGPAGGFSSVKCASAELSGGAV